MKPTLPIEALRAIAGEQARAIAGLRLVVVFGSVARGGARADSDVDIGVLGGGFWQQLALGSALAGELGRERAHQKRPAPTAMSTLCASFRKRLPGWMPWSAFWLG